ncbi:MAG TPA: hypothetical protein DCW90_18270 [Lachnospiraceae bacterium]|nr:hypothetical protein [Lachnospiraceae bacterium]
MKINEFVTMMSDIRVKKMSDEQLLKKLTADLEVVTYKPILEKKKLVGEIVNASLKREDGIYKVDPVAKFVALVMFTIKAYTNLEIPENIYEAYDELCAAGVLRAVVDTFQMEFDEIHGFVELQEKYVLESNSLESKAGIIEEKISELMGVVVSSARAYMEASGISVQDLLKQLSNLGDE